MMLSISFKSVLSYIFKVLKWSEIEQLSDNIILLPKIRITLGCSISKGFVACFSDLGKEILVYMLKKRSKVSEKQCLHF